MIISLYKRDVKPYISFYKRIQSPPISRLNCCYLPYDLPSSAFKPILSAIFPSSDTISRLSAPKIGSLCTKPRRT